MRVLLLTGALVLSGCGSTVSHPNLLLIIADDQSWTDFGFMGSPHVRTPNLDRLAREGTVFTHGFNTASICRPSLRTLLTGLDPLQWHHQVARLEQAGIRRAPAHEIADFQTLPRLLSAQGYASFEGGKFWEADHEIAGFTHGMQSPGADPSYGGIGRFLGREPLTPLFDFIDGRGDEPFFVWFAPQLPHYPHDPPERLRARYAGDDYSAPAVLYYANVDRLDEVVGALLAHLEERQIRERTLIVFLSDNGWDQEPEAEPTGVHGGPRGKKTLYELGFRTPIVFSWPDVIPEGVRCDELVSTVDVFATLLDYAGTPIPEGRPGRSLRPLIEGSGAWSRDAIYGHMTNLLLPPEMADVPPPPAGGYAGTFVRTRRWRFVSYEGLDRDALFDIEADPREEVDVAASHPALVAEFRRRIAEWKREMAQPLPTPPPGTPAP